MLPTRLDQLRILEIGEFRMFKAVLPEQTTRFSTTLRAEPEGPGERAFDLAAFISTVRALRSGGKFDLVVCYVPRAGIRKPGDGLVRGSLRRLSTLLRRFQRLGPQVLRTNTPTPVAALDYADEAVIGRHAFFLLDRATRFFKRELPQDATRAFLGPTSPFTSLPAIQKSAVYQRNASKLLPISSGVPDEFLDTLPPIFPEKEIDLFYSGASSHSAVRERGRRLLESLKGEGLRIDCVDGGLPRGEYFRRAARAWLAWSPEGYGWETFRHYEMLFAGTVPVINRPTIQRYAPLVDGIHCRFYDADGDDLLRVVRDALQDRGQLARIATQGRAHVMRHFTHRAICEYVARCCGVLAHNEIPTN